MMMNMRNPLVKYIQMIDRPDDTVFSLEGQKSQFWSFKVQLEDCLFPGKMFLNLFSIILNHQNCHLEKQGENYNLSHSAEIWLRYAQTGVGPTLVYTGLGDRIYTQTQTLDKSGQGI